MGIVGFNIPWLYTCFDNWTHSYVQTKAWKFHNNFDGFVRWFLGVSK